MGANAIQGQPALGPESEDCLFLNVYAPAGPSKTPLPTMVWFHGGAYTTGCSNLYPGHALVVASNSSVVVVTVNYSVSQQTFSLLSSTSFTFEKRIVFTNCFFKTILSFHSR